MELRIFIIWIYNASKERRKSKEISFLSKIGPDRFQNGDQIIDEVNHAHQHTQSTQSIWHLIQ